MTLPTVFAVAGPATLLFAALAACGSFQESPPRAHASPEAAAEADVSEAGVGESLAAEEAHSKPNPKAPVEPRAEPSTGSKPAGSGGLMAGMLEAHNQFRQAHCAAPLSWSDKLARDARAWAENLRDQGCGLMHDNDTRDGENLAMFTPSGRVGAADVAAGWYGEEAEYNYQQPGFSRRTGHFTQVVWQDTRELGCAVVTCGGGDVWVCRYHPSGNYRGQYRDQVLPKTCR